MIGSIFSKFSSVSARCSKLHLFAKAGFLFLSSLILGLSSPLSVFAEPNAAQLYFINQNNTNFYDPTGSDDCSDYVGSSYNGETTAYLVQSQTEWVVRWHDLVEELSIQFGIPWEIAMAQSLQESGGGTSPMALKRNNFHGIHAFTSDNGASAYVYPDAANGWVGYFDNITRTPVYRSKGAFDVNSSYGNAVTDPFAYLQVIVDSGYAGDPSYAAAVALFANGVLKLAEEQGWPTSSELAAEHPEMLENASRISASGKSPYERFGGGTFASPFSFNYVGLDGVEGGTGGSTRPGGITSNSACGLSRGNGSINDTALDLAWPDTEHGCNPKPEYVDAMKAVGTWDEDLRGCSCDRFVATVMRYSGADPNFEFYGTSAQFNYLRSHPELYQEIPNRHSTAEMQPGDIMIVQSTANNANGHIMMYVRQPDGTEGIASASLRKRTGGFGKGVFYEDDRGEYTIFRYIGSY